MVIYISCRRSLGSEHVIKVAQCNPKPFLLNSWKKDFLYRLLGSCIKTLYMPIWNHPSTILNVLPWFLPSPCKNTPGPLASASTITLFRFGWSLDRSSSSTKITHVNSYLRGTLGYLLSISLPLNKNGPWASTVYSKLIISSGKYYTLDCPLNTIFETECFLASIVVTGILLTFWTDSENF